VWELFQTLPALVVGVMVLWRLGPMLGLGRAKSQSDDLAARRGTQALWITLAFVAIGFAFYSPFVFRGVNDLTGNPASAALGALAGQGGAATGVRTAVKFMRGTRSRGWPWGDWIVSAGVFAAVVVVLQVWPPGPPSPILYDTTYWWDSTWRSALVSVPLVGTLSWALIASFLMWWRYGRIAPRGAVRTGLALVAAGSVVGMLWVAVRFTTLVVWEAGDQTRWWVNFDRLGEAITLLGSGVLLSWGTSWEDISAQVDGWHKGWSASRDAEDLEPLWQTLIDLYPQVRMVDGLGRRHGRRGLLRRVVEIRDGLLALDDGADPEVVDIVTARVIESATAPEGIGAVVVAVTLRLAALNGLHRATPGGELPSGGGEDLESEVRWLRQVAAAYLSPEAVEMAQQVSAELVSS
jgi:hypothetical protein